MQNFKRQRGTVDTPATGTGTGNGTKKPATKPAGKPIPNTATNMYNYLLVGILFVGAGITLFIRRRKIQN